MNERELRSARKGKGNEKIELYVKAAEKYNLDICLFSLSNINNKEGTVTAYQKNKHKWVRRRMDIPKVIHNRTKLGNRNKKKINKLKKQFGVTIYNSWNTFSKLKIHELLYENSSIRSYLPVTHLFTQENLLLYMDHSSFFLKPDRGSLGKGVMKIIKLSDNNWQINCYEKKRKKTYQIHERDLFSFLTKYIGKRKYILQETINLKTYTNSPFDIRVSVQNNHEGIPQVTGMVGKVAAKGSHLSNVYQGGSTVQLTSLFPANDELQQVQNQLSQLALDIVHELNKHIPWIADVGFDFGINENDEPRFIEVNFRDQRYSFLAAGMEQTFHSTYDNPVSYGKYLLSR